MKNIFFNGKIIPFTIKDLAKITNHRSGEIKFGEKMITVPKDTDSLTFLTTCEANMCCLESRRI
jgi:formiminoglutamase